MDFVPSVSRSSGLQDDGDKLKNSKFQEEFRSFIETKLQSYWLQYPLESHLTTRSNDEQKHTQSNILILLRKLREGIIASRRLDAFSLEVYQTSLNLSVIFRMAAQTTAIVTQLIPHTFRETGLYQSITSRSNPIPSDLTEGVAAISLSKPSQQGRKTKPIYQPPQKRRGKSKFQAEPQTMQTVGKPFPSTFADLASSIELAVLISLLNTLVQEYPRQASFHSQTRWFYCLDDGKFWNRNSPSLRYIMVLTKSLTSNNFTLFEQISRESSIKKILDQIMSSDGAAERNLRQIAIKSSMYDLRMKVREAVWRTLRNTYREADSLTSISWLARTLMLPIPLEDNDLTQTRHCVETWFLQRKTEVSPKDGVEGRWILHR